ncbi:MAG: hypothetical protein ACK49N_10435 [Verrucomicrobiota bacterium]
MKQNLWLIWFARGLTTLVLVLACWAMTRHLDKPMLGPHSFRQTQTAISTYYMAEDASVFADYITPVLGKPWRIPMELPIYQWLVARWHNLSGMALDSSGKLVSIMLWLACIVPTCMLLRSLRLGRAQITITLALALSSPLYIFWSNAFLIESTGLLLVLSMVACLVRGHEMKCWRYLIAALLLGVLAIMCKATTWAVAAGTSTLLLIFRDGWPQWRAWFRRGEEGAPGGTPGHTGGAILAAASLCLLLPFIAGKLWLSHGGSIKSANPFAHEIILSSSAHQAKWNYGTWEQKLDPATWLAIWRHITDQLLVPFPFIGPFLMPLILIAGAIAAPRRIALILIFLAGFASGPIVFTNLYFEHSYYWCANGIWLLMAVGVALSGIFEFKPEKIWPQVTALALAAAVAVSGFIQWFRNYLPILTSLPSHEQLAEAWVKPVQGIVPPERTLLVVGHDWNPNALYYAERKGIAYPSSAGIQFPGPQLTESLAMLGPEEKLGAVVIAEPLLSQENQAALASILQQLGMSQEGRHTAFGIMFPAEDLKSGRSPQR